MCYYGVPRRKYKDFASDSLPRSFLQSLDSVPGDGRISIPANLQSAAVHSDGNLAASIRSLDFADETAFVNAASQLIATLTASYPFTAVLVDADSARQHLSQSVKRLNP